MAARRGSVGSARLGYHPRMRPFISFLTDFGPDAAAAICRGVMLGSPPTPGSSTSATGAHVRDPRRRRTLLWIALPSMPVGVHVAVVDPGVGTARLPVGLRTARGDVLIGPDNGLLLPAAEALGGHRRGTRPRQPRADAAAGQLHLPRPGHLLADGRAPRRRRHVRGRRPSAAGRDARLAGDPPTVARRSFDRSSSMS